MQLTSVEGCISFHFHRMDVQSFPGIQGRGVRNSGGHIWLSKKFDKFLWEASSVAFLLPEIQQMTEYTNKKIKGDIHDYKNALPTLSGWSHFIDVSTISTEACLKSVRRWNGIWSAATRRTEGRVHEERSQALLHWFKSIFWLKLHAPGNSGSKESIGQQDTDFPFLLFKDEEFIYIFDNGKNRKTT
ncbi:hypothetical protein ACJX0J_004829, partial (mitochondrion) [Zea mays]